MQFKQWALIISLHCCATVLLYAAVLYPTPEIANYSEVLAIAIVLGNCIILALGYFATHDFSTIGKRFVWVAMFISSISSFLTIQDVLNFSSWRKTVVSIEKNQIQTLGQHFIIGFRDDEAIQELVQTGAIGGIFITTRNIKGKSPD